MPWQRLKIPWMKKIQVIMKKEKRHLSAFFREEYVVLRLRWHWIQGCGFNIVNVKHPFLADLEIEIMKKLILEYKRHSQKCPRLLLRNMKQFILGKIWKLLQLKVEVTLMKSCVRKEMNLLGLCCGCIRLIRENGG